VLPNTGPSCLASGAHLPTALLACCCLPIPSDRLSLRRASRRPSRVKVGRQSSNRLCRDRDPPALIGKKIVATDSPKPRGNQVSPSCSSVASCRRRSGLQCRSRRWSCRLRVRALSDSVPRSRACLRATTFASVKLGCPRHTLSRSARGFYRCFPNPHRQGDPASGAKATSNG
jgi:hypothetical protein